MNAYYKIITTIFLFILLNSVNSISQDFFGQVAFPDGQNGQVIAVDLNNNVYVGVWGKGILKSTDQGNTFVLKNNGLTNFLIKDIYVTQNGSIFVATMGGGIFRSNDGANTWTPVNNGLKTLHITAIKQYPTGIIMAGSYGYGVFYSTDNGANWKQSKTGLAYRAITALETTKNGYILAATYGGGIYQSRDTLKTWKKSNSGIPTQFIHKFAKNSVGDIFAATNGKGVYVSPNDGLSWGTLDTTGMEDLNVTCIIISGSNEEIIGTRNGGIQYYDKDLYFMWRTPFQPMMGVTSFARSSNNRIYAVGTFESMFVSSNNGRNWTELGKIKDGYPFVAYSPKPSVVLSQFNNKSVYVSNDYGNTWNLTNLPQQPLNGVIKTNIERYFAATNGLYYSDDGTNWTKVNRFGDTLITSISFLNGLMVFSTLFQPPPPEPPGQPDPPIVKMYASTDGGNTFNQVNYPPNQAHCTKLKIGYNGYIYAQLGNNLYRKTLADANWTQITLNGFSWLTLQDFDVDNSNFIYVATNRGVLKSQDNGQTWTHNNIKFKSQDSLNTTSITASPNGHIYAVAVFSRSIFPANGVWRTTNSGFKWDSILTNITSNPNIQFSIDGDNNIYMASNALYRSYYPNNMTAPILLSPENNLKGSPLNPTLIWQPAPKAELYEMQISEDVNFGYYHEFVVQADTIYEIEKPLDYNKVYYWRVRSKTDGSYSNWSNVFSFSTKLNAPKLIYPNNNSSGISLTPKFEWNLVPNAKVYELIVSGKQDFSSTVFTADSLKDTILISPTLQADQTFYWKVRAKSDYSISDWSEIWSFKTTFGAPELIYPPKDTINIPIDLEFVWGKVENSKYYKLKYSKNANMQDSIEVQLDTNRTKVNKLDYDTKYYWQVKTGNAQGESDYSNIWNFTTLIQPVVLTSPANKTNNIAIKPKLTWEKLTAYDKYQLQLSTTEDFSKIILDTLLTNLSSIDLKELYGFTEYFWRVRVNQNPKLGYWSEIFSFRTVINKPGLRFPENHSTNHPTTLEFLWFPQQGAKYYFLQIARDKNFNDLIISKDSIQNTLFKAEGLEFDREYFWRVRASNDIGFSDWSEVWDFRTSAVRPVLLRPANNSTGLDNPVILEWRTIQGATNYFLQISKDENFNNLVISQDKYLTNLYEFTGEYNGTYFWRVKVKINNYESDWSPVWTFTMKPVSVKEITSNTQIVIYPNPVSEILHIKIQNQQMHPEKLDVLDIFGNKVLEVNTQANNGFYSIKLDQFASGSYIIRIYNGSDVFYSNFKIIK